MVEVAPVHQNFENQEVSLAAFDVAETSYITTDLVLRSKFDLTHLVRALERRKVFLLGEIQKYEGTWMATLELITIQREGRKNDPEKDISKMLKAIMQFDETELKHWNACKSRTFSLGYESGPKPFEFTSLLSPKLIRAIAEVNAGVEIVIYQRLAVETVN